MTFKTLLHTLGASALIGAMAFTAVPASAQDDDDRPSRAQRQPDRRVADDPAAPRAEAQAARQQYREQRAQAVQRAQQPQRTYQAPQAQSGTQREWNRGVGRSNAPGERAGREWNRRDNANNDWGQARAAQAQAEAQARAQLRERQQAEATRGSQWQRNGTYRDGRRDQAEATRQSQQWQRNSTYRDGRRDGSYGSGYRDGVRADQRQDRYQQRNAYSNGYRDGARTDGYRGDYRRWSNDWRRDNRYNWYGYRNANRSLFSIGRYYSPYSNYRYSRLGIGFTLSSGFYGNNYWINDPWQYRLPAAYGPYRWIRYYDDAMLVNIYTGQVEDVIYDFFW